MLALCEGDIVSRCDGEPRVFVAERKRTRGFEAELVNIPCSAVNIRNPRAHVPSHWQLPVSCVKYHGEGDGMTIPAVKRTHTGGAYLLGAQVLRAPVCAAYLRR